MGKGKERKRGCWGLLVKEQKREWPSSGRLAGPGRDMRAEYLTLAYMTANNFN